MKRLIPLLVLLLTASALYAESEKKPDRTSNHDVEYLANEDSPYPFSDAVRVGNMLYLSGKIGLDPETGELVEGGITEQTRQTMENIGRILEKYGSSFDEVVKCTVMIDDIEDWPKLNEVYRTYFKDHFPARSAIGADGLALGAKVEIECWATVAQ